MNWYNYEGSPEKYLRAEKDFNGTTIPKGESSTPGVFAEIPATGQSFEEYLKAEEQRIILRERARIAQAMKRSPLVTYDQRQPLLDIIFNKN